MSDVFPSVVHITMSFLVLFLIKPAGLNSPIRMSESFFDLFCCAVLMPTKPVWQSKLCSLLCVSCIACEQGGYKCGDLVFDFFSARCLLEVGLQDCCILILLEWNFELLCFEPLRQKFHVLLKTCFYIWNRHPFFLYLYRGDNHWHNLWEVLHLLLVSHCK